MSGKFSALFSVMRLYCFSLKKKKSLSRESAWKIPILICGSKHENGLMQPDWGKDRGFGKKKKKSAFLRSLLPLVLESSVFPPWGVLSASPGGASPALWRTRPGCTGVRCCGGWTCPGCCRLGWARSWNPASGWSSTQWRSWNAHSWSSAASLFWGWRKLKGKETIQGIAPQQFLDEVKN